jgi:hypothetical protein
VISRKSVTSILDKFKTVHKRRISVEELARELNPVIRGAIKLLLQVLVLPYAPVMASAESAITEVGAMGKGTLQDSFGEVVEAEVHNTSRLIRTLEIGTSVGMAIREGMLM